jgi:4a-hydroxytetrahydrobiopterin dehydratase
MPELTQKHCTPCRGGIPKLAGDNLKGYEQQVPAWRVMFEHHLAKTFVFPDFKSGLDFVNAVGALAEAEGHHPDVCLSWGKVDVMIYTHKLDGLSENDFILAAKIDQLPSAK